MKRFTILGASLLLLIALMFVTMPMTTVNAQSSTATPTPTATLAATLTPAPSMPGEPNVYGQPPVGLDMTRLITVTTLSYPANVQTPSTSEVKLGVFDDGDGALDGEDWLVLSAQRVEPRADTRQPTLQLCFGTTDMINSWFFPPNATAAYCERIHAWNSRDEWHAVNLSLVGTYDEERSYIIAEVGGAFNTLEIPRKNYGIYLWEENDVIYWAYPANQILTGMFVEQQSTGALQDVFALGESFWVSLMIADEQPSPQPTIAQQHMEINLQDYFLPSLLPVTATSTVSVTPAATLTPTQIPAVTLISQFGLTCSADAQNVTFNFVAPAVTNPTTRVQMAFGSGALDGWDSFDANAGLLIRYDAPYIEVVTSTGNSFASGVDTTTGFFLYDADAVSLTMPRFLIDQFGGTMNLHTVHSINGGAIVPGFDYTVSFSTSMCASVISPTAAPTVMPSPTP